MHGVMSLGLFEGWQTKVMSKSEKASHNSIGTSCGGREIHQQAS